MQSARGRSELSSTSTSSRRGIYHNPLTRVVLQRHRNRQQLPVHTSSLCIRDKLLEVIFFLISSVNIKHGTHNKLDVVCINEDLNTCASCDLLLLAISANGRRLLRHKRSLWPSLIILFSIFFFFLRKYNKRW